MLNKTHNRVNDKNPLNHSRDEKKHKKMRYFCLLTTHSMITSRQQKPSLPTLMKAAILVKLGYQYQQIQMLNQTVDLNAHLMP